MAMAKMAKYHSLETTDEDLKAKWVSEKYFSGVYVPANHMVLNLGSNFCRKSRKVRTDWLLLSWGSSEPPGRREHGVFLHVHVSEIKFSEQQKMNTLLIVKCIKSTNIQ